MSPTTTQPSVTKRRSAAKRHIVSSTDEEADDTRFQPSTGKRARTAETDDSQVDIVDTPTEESRFLPDGTPPLSHPTRPKKNTKKSAPKPKQLVVHLDEDGDFGADANIEDDPVDIDFLSSDLDDDNLEVDSTSKRGRTKATSSKNTAAKGKLGPPKSAKGKTHKEREIFIKDERKLLALPSSTPRASSATTHTETTAQEEPASVVPSASSKSVPDTTATQGAAEKDAANPPVPKRRKLPTITKTRQPGAVGTTPALSNPTTTTKPSGPLPPSTGDLVKPPLPSIQQRKTALSGTQDFDLRQPNIYAELFKPGGASAPGSSLTRREKEEERRKELNRMRDEARAKRAEEAKITFDLQAQAEKIARFERRLRGENSSALHPNFLAAKFRDEWEIERRRRRDGGGTSRDEGDTHSVTH